MRNILKPAAASLCLALLGGIFMGQGTPGATATPTPAATPTAPAEMVDNPAYVAWSKSKVGTSITYKMDMSVNMAGMPQPMKNEGTIIQTLKEVKPDSVTVEAVTKMSMNGQAMPPQTASQAIPSKVEKGKEWAGPEARGEISDMKTGKESVDVNGKSYNAETRAFTIKMTEPVAMTTQIKMWTTPEVPGGMVKMETKSATPMDTAMTMTLVEVVQK